MKAQVRARPDGRPAWRVALGNVIFDNDTPAGRVFDIVLSLLIVGSVLSVMLESVSGIRARYGTALRDAELLFTLLFSVEYLLRLIGARRASHYARSFFGVVDLLSILPVFSRCCFRGRRRSRWYGRCGCCGCFAFSSWRATSARRAC